MIHIEDDILYLRRLGLLDKLLLDRTTRRNIVWGSGAHAGLGKEYESGCEIRGELITGDRSGVIKTRARKELGARSDRTRKNGEVFTPLWICRRMNDYADETWKEAEAARGGKSPAARWRRCVDRRVLEITCGEAPYLASRYDAATGEEIPLAERVGIIDRKLRAVDENTTTEGEWLKWAFRAFEAAYGYELLGDNLVIARVNLFMTFDENLRRRWERAPTMRECLRLVKIITWNIWQADGLTGKTPRFEQWDGERRQRGLFDGIEGYTDETQSGEAPYCRVFDWRSRRAYEYGARLGEGGRAKMKFDFIIGNPPYQEDLESSTNQAKPVYHRFVEQAQKLSSNAVSLIIPSRWFAGGMGLENFRTTMMNDTQIRKIVDYINAKECFPNSSISGGVCYFVWQKGTTGACDFININNGVVDEMSRYLNEFPVLVRYNAAVSIIHKIKKSNEASMMSIVSAISPFGISTKERGYASKQNASDVLLYSSQGTGYIPLEQVTKGHEYIGHYHVILSRSSAEHAGEPDKNGMYRVFTSSMKVIKPGEVCTHSYLIIGNYDTDIEVNNVIKYIQTKFVRALALLAISSINISKASFVFVPIQDFTSSSDIDWSKSIAEIDRQLYAKYRLSDEEINFIETHVKEMA